MHRRSEYGKICCALLLISIFSCREVDSGNGLTVASGNNAVEIASPEALYNWSNFTTDEQGALKIRNRANCIRKFYYLDEFGTMVYRDFIRPGREKLLTGRVDSRFMVTDDWNGNLAVLRILSSDTGEIIVGGQIEIPQLDPPTEEYVRHCISGFTVYINPLASSHKETEKLLKEITTGIEEIVSFLPAIMLAELQKIKIWVEWNKRKKAGVHNPSEENMIWEGANPDKAGGITIDNVRYHLWILQFQPMALFHELAHGYHHQVLGFDNDLIAVTFERVKKSGIYDSIVDMVNRRQTSYAMSSDREYFEELSEAYFS